MPQRAYEDIGARFRQGAGRAAVGRGAYDDAIRYDPDNAPAYSAQQERVETRQREQDTRSANTAMAGAINTGDYAGARNVAAKTGDMQSLAAVNTLRSQFESEEARADLRRAYTGLRQLEQRGTSQSQYDQWRSGEIAALRQRGEDTSGFEGKFPAQFNPRLVAAARAEIDQLLEQALDPEQVIALRSSRADDARADATLNETIRHNQETERRLGRVAASGGGRSSYRPITPQEAQSFGLPNNGAGYAMGSNGRPVRVAAGGGGSGAMSDGQRVASGSATRMRDAERQIELARNARPSAWANALEAVPIVGEEWASGARSDTQDTLDQASSQWSESFLRATSGAAVTPDEARRIERIFMPRPGDSAATLERKRRARAVAMDAIEMGLPDRAMQAIDAASGGGDASSMSEEELEAIANGGE